MSVTNQPRLNFTGTDIQSVNIVVLKKYADAGAEIRQTIIPKIWLDHEKPENFKILMDVTVESDSFFKIELSLSGSFILNTEATDEHNKIFMHTNAPAILFPYVRSFISTITANMGANAGTIIIPPQVFKGGDIEVVNGQEEISSE
ncbi:protein-export chaperone SecB [Mucilaginibacter sp. E4BP6]|uniref:protein-export chaperone SecB n=1 Tax=Mucilaginibacter sp. E4BP6 TaxID=2723089 RepID=UPI0015CE1E1C|nr:protein-export chaperone SecB [Mucilaginibacter sp. E4BP6]NYE67801.1 preprotein translocase subunit SecB [Mucilaginibacter sp. E4BP6]